MLAHLIALPVAAYITRNHHRLIEGAAAIGVALLLDATFS